MARYSATYSFDAGSGICLWSFEDRVTTEHDFTLDLEEIVHDAELLQAGQAVIRWYDDLLPDGEDRGSVDDWDRWRSAALDFLERLRNYLGHDWEIAVGPGLRRGQWQPKRLR